MKLLLKLTIVQNGELPLKGEELDEVIETAMRDVDLERAGWTVEGVSLCRAEEAKRASREEERDFKALRVSVAKLADLCDDGKGAEASAVNPDYTNAQMLGWQAKLLLRKLGVNGGAA